MTTAGEFPVILGYSTSTSAVTNTVNKTSTLKYNPSTKILTAPTFKGNLTGNADTATKATQDASGNIITDTYETKEDANAKLKAAKTYANNAANTVKNDLLNGAGGAYDTLKELGDLIDENKDAIDALREIASGKQNKINLTANKALISDGAGNVVTSDITSTELGHLSGIDDNIQTQLDAKANKTDIATTKYVGLTSESFTYAKISDFGAWGTGAWYQKGFSMLLTSRAGETIWFSLSANDSNTSAKAFRIMNTYSKINGVYYSVAESAVYTKMSAWCNNLSAHILSNIYGDYVPTVAQATALPNDAVEVPIVEFGPAYDGLVVGDTSVALLLGGSADRPTYNSNDLALKSDIPTTYAGSSTAGGAATSAVKLATARTIGLSGDVSGSASFDGSGNVTISATVADDSHNHVIANIDNLQSTLNSKVSKAGDTMTGRLQLNMANPHIHMKDTGYSTDWYFQAYQDQLAFGPTFATAVKTDKNGNMTVPGMTNSTKFVSSQGLAVTQTDGTSGHGIALYGSATPQTYGLWFGKTSTYGTHGSVTSDWATYFGMNSGATTRGWVFRREDGCVASISGAGNLTLNGSAKIGNAVTMAYDSANECLNFIF